MKARGRRAERRRRRRVDGPPPHSVAIVERVAQAFGYVLLVVTLIGFAGCTVAFGVDLVTRTPDQRKAENTRGSDFDPPEWVERACARSEEACDAAYDVLLSDTGR